MPGKTPKEAVENFAKYFRETLSCVTTGYPKAFQQSPKLFKITCDPPLKLTRRSGGNLFIIATQILGTTVCDGGHKAKTREYSYRLVGTEDIAAPDIVAYHWHPNESDLRSPHLHIAGSKVHFPSSRIALEDFVEMLIRYYDVKPKLLHAEWTGILEKNKAAFESSATWKIKHPPS